MGSLGEGKSGRKNRLPRLSTFTRKKTMTNKEFLAGIRSDDKDLACACGLFYMVLRMKEEAEKKERLARPEIFPPNG